MLATAETPVVTDFAHAFTTEAKFVWNSLRRLGVKRADLEDVTHEVFIAVHRHWHQYDRARPLRPWLFAFAYNTAARYKDLVRHTREVLDDELEAVDPARGADEQLDRQKLQARLQVALDQLPIDQKAVFIMHDVDETPIPEVADALQIPLNTAYSRLRLARGTLKKLIGGVA